MAGRKRAAPEDVTSARPAKATKTSAGRAKGKTGPKTNLSMKTFKSQAHPLHITLTHTPPPVTEDPSEKPSTESTDPGFLAALSLQPSSFSTGTYGWKGSKRVTIEVDNPGTGEKEKLQVQLTFNATVLGSKGKDGEDEGTKDEEEKEDKVEEKGEAGKEKKVGESGEADKEGKVEDKDEAGKEDKEEVQRE